MAIQDLVLVQDEVALEQIYTWGNEIKNHVQWQVQ